MDVLSAVDSQKNIFNSLSKAKHNNRLSHAYLFYGDKGVGKKEMAYALACLHYCPNGGCLTCDTCKSIINNNHMNVNYIGIDDNKKMISKEQITKLQEEFSLTSLVSGERIYIVDGIDTASTSAQNSLLKFIEEPINNTPTIGIFLATELSNVVSTIISRCNLIHFNAIRQDIFISNLIKLGYPELDSILSSLLTNNINDAENIIKSEAFNKNKELFLELINIENNKDLVIYYVKNQNHFSTSDNLSILLTWLLSFISDCNYINNPDNLLLKPLYDKIKIYNKRCNNDIKKKMEFILELLNKIRYNVVLKNIFHDLICNF